MKNLSHKITNGYPTEKEVTDQPLTDQYKEIDLREDLTTSEKFLFMLAGFGATAVIAFVVWMVFVLLSK